MRKHFYSVMVTAVLLLGLGLTFDQEAEVTGPVSILDESRSNALMLDVTGELNRPENYATIMSHRISKEADMMDHIYDVMVVVTLIMCVVGLIRRRDWGQSTSTHSNRMKVERSKT